MKKHEYRLLFLKEFTKQLILQSKPKGRAEEVKKEKSEELIYLITEPANKTENLMPKEEVLELVQGAIKPITQEITKQPRQEQPVQVIQFSKVPQISQTFKTSSQVPSPALSVPAQRYRLQPIIPAGFKPSSMPLIEGMQPTTISVPENFNLGKIDILVKDRKVTAIECQGPGKFITINSFGRTSVTKISLTQEEIQEVIDKFSKEAKVPVISGLFKAAVGNTIVSAVISEMVGSRFIITKITPQFVVEQVNRAFQPNFR